MRRVVIQSQGRGSAGCFGPLFLLFTSVPLLELWLLVVLGRHVGLLPTLGLVIFTGALGAYLARDQGLRALRAVQAELAAGRMPTASLLDALLVLVAGAVLLTPGLLTDLLGFSLLVPATRALIRRRIAAWLKKRFAVQTAGAPPYAAGPENRPFDGSRNRDHGDEDDDVIVLDGDDVREL